MLTNSATFKYDYLSQNVEMALGLNRDEIYAQGVPYLVNKVHPDDAYIWIAALKDLMYFCITEVPKAKRTRICAQYNYRFQPKPGKILNIVENQIPLELDDQGKPIVFLGHIAAYDDQTPYPIKASARVLNERNEYETVFFRNYGTQHLLGGLSNREQDILRLLSLGKTSKEIANNLFISPHTVDTHRRNILHKIGISSTSEIIAFCRQNIWI